jgi:serine/threonine protein phosphatase PrpC
MTDDSNISLTLYSQTDVGMVRSGNEDNFLILDLTTGSSWTASEPANENLLKFTQGYYGSLLAVSDGMGGALAGEVASRLAVETVRDRMLQLQAHRVYRQLPFYERLRLSIEEANLLINGESLSNPEHKGLGATFTAAAVEANRVFFAQVGDSRAYLIRQGKIIRITKDQSLVQQLIDAGQITEEEAETHSYRNVILQALGAHGNVNVEVNSLKLCGNDTLVLCSDGLSGKVRADEIVRMIDAANSLSSACEHLIALANERGGEDNITVLIVKFEGKLAAAQADSIELESLQRLPGTPTELKWEISSETEPLSESHVDDIRPGATEPLPEPPPSHFTKSQGERPRVSSEIPKAGAVRRPRTEPITSVFSAGEYEDVKEVKDIQPFSQPPKPPDSNEPKNSDSSEPSAGANANLRSQSPSVQMPAVESRTAQLDKRQTARFRTMLIATYGIVAVLAAVLLTFWYLSIQEKKRIDEERTVAARRKQLENVEQREALLSRVQDRLVTVERNLIATDAGRNKDKRKKLEEQLEKVKAKFEGAKALPADQIPEIERACLDVEKKLSELQGDIEKLIEKHLRGGLHREESSLHSVTC